MTVTLKYNKLFAYSETKAKSFLTEFDSINIVHGRNTSGKSTLFLSILYAFGINDGNQYLKELLDDKIIFRLDCTLTKENKSEILTIIRDDDTMFIKKDGIPIQRFNGISSNNSGEHVKLKLFLNNLFDFSLHLESKNEFKPAPIETMFLPYYISQTVGWVYLRKTFSGLEFYKNLKEDYIDYYLGLEPSIDRVKRHELQTKLKNKQDEISLISKFELTNEDIQLTKLTDEKFVETSGEYIENYSKNYSALTEKENDYVLKCNELGFLQERKTILIKTSASHKAQQPEVGNCPTCTQTLPFGISETYTYLQDQNDTDHEISVVKGKIKDVQSKINSLKKAIEEEREIIAREYSTLNKYVNSGVSYEKWLKNKANAELISTLNEKIGFLTVEKNKIEEDLKQYKTDAEIEKSRNTQSNAFTSLFAGYLKQLGVKELKEDRYTKLYQISAFPSQGVELHKTIMAYHFAFNNLIADTNDIHRLPFMLDAIFKEDLDDENKSVILKFINKNKPSDTQLIISIAQSKTQLNNASKFNSDFFGGTAKLIRIGDGESERTFLTDFKEEYSEYLTETLEIINGNS